MCLADRHDRVMRNDAPVFETVCALIVRALARHAHGELNVFADHGAAPSTIVALDLARHPGVVFPRQHVGALPLIVCNEVVVYHVEVHDVLLTHGVGVLDQSSQRGDAIAQNALALGRGEVRHNISVAALELPKGAVGFTVVLAVLGPNHKFHIAVPTNQSTIVSSIGQSRILVNQNKPSKINDLQRLICTPAKSMTYSARNFPSKINDLQVLSAKTLQIAGFLGIDAVLIQPVSGLGRQIHVDVAREHISVVQQPI